MKLLPKNLKEQALTKCYGKLVKIVSSRIENVIHFYILQLRDIYF
jgi:hypothetical protein